MATTSPSSSPIPFLDLRSQHQPLAAQFVAAFERVLKANAFILGEEVDQFEAAYAAFCGVRHCIGVNSGTAALLIMLKASGIGAGDEVIVPAHTFIATALAVRQAGAIPVCADVDPGSGLIDPASVAAAIGPRTAAVLPVHLYGQICDMDELRLLAEQHGLLILEDAAQAHGATYRGRRAGSLGSAAAFSFYPSKNLGALGDAGAICTNDDHIAEAARRLRDLGRLGDGRHALAGYNERLDGVQAAFLRVKLEHLDTWNEARRRVAAAYRERLREVDVALLVERPESPCIYHLFPIRLSRRDAVARILAEAGIATGMHYPLSLAEQPALPELAAYPVPAARDWAATELSLPIFPDLSTPHVTRIAAAIAAEVGSQGRAS